MVFRLGLALAFLLGCYQPPDGTVAAPLDDCIPNDDHPPSGEGEPDMGVEVVGNSRMVLIRRINPSGLATISADTEWAFSLAAAENYPATAQYASIPSEYNGARAHVHITIFGDGIEAISFKAGLLGLREMPRDALLVQTDDTAPNEQIANWFPLGRLNGGASITGATNVGIRPRTDDTRLTYSEQLDHASSYNGIALVITEINALATMQLEAYLSLEQP